MVVHRQHSTEYLVPGTRLTVTRAIDDIRLGNIYQWVQAMLVAPLRVDPDVLNNKTIKDETVHEPCRTGVDHCT